MTTLYAATCPSCGAPVTGTLWSDPSVPRYLCGAYGDRGAECRAIIPPPDAIDNLATLTDADLADLDGIGRAVNAGLILAGAWGLVGPVAVALDDCGCAELRCQHVVQPVPVP